MSIFTTLFGVKAIQNSAIEILNPKEYKSQIENKKVQLIDVRTSGEFKTGHIKNAKNIDLFSKNFADEFNKLNKEEVLYIYCRSGARSKQASNKLVAMGFKKIYDLKGGILNYKH
ncbi:rhodanese [Pseudalgibacter alginicilyticus]|uniref:Rhodanese n=2 Tax=Pseudalgibacter alginicilyticus TaxID=1736674 RepID=A0A0P0D0I6_9FLAO|nr:rhodanese-like domain-containing protein [Pseudalgibacter alginicilyticus]ALJ04250.1 rhodanese [Pseudalgibacter alginicilyticus]